jgi:hypothetical protein
VDLSRERQHRTCQPLRSVVLSSKRRLQLVARSRRADASFAGGTTDCSDARAARASSTALRSTRSWTGSATRGSVPDSRIACLSRRTSRTASTRCPGPTVAGATSPSKVPLPTYLPFALTCLLPKLPSLSSATSSSSSCSLSHSAYCQVPHTPSTRLPAPPYLTHLLYSLLDPRITNLEGSLGGNQSLILIDLFFLFFSLSCFF